MRPRRIFKGSTGLLCLARTPRPQISMGTPWVTLVLGQVTRSPKILSSKQYGRDSSLFFDMVPICFASKTHGSCNYHLVKQDETLSSFMQTCLIFSIGSNTFLDEASKQPRISLKGKKKEKEERRVGV